MKKLTCIEEDLGKETLQEKREVEEQRRYVEMAREISEHEEDLAQRRREEIQSTMGNSRVLRTDQEEVIVTEENMHRVSTVYKGLLRNDDGSYSITPQFKTWSNNPRIQQQTSYSEGREMPPYINERYHLQPTWMNLKRSHLPGDQSGRDIQGKRERK